MKIGIIGADTTHTVAFAKFFMGNSACSLEWIDPENHTKLQFSLDRTPDIIDSLVSIEAPLLDGEPRTQVDAYCILNLDASTHRKLIEELSTFGKPIFVDKPIFYSLEDFTDLEGLIFSSSALRYCSFMKEAQQLYDRGDRIHVEGPLSFIDGIDGYFWYGIHLIEMIHSLGNDELSIHGMSIDDDQELIWGFYGSSEFTLKGIKKGNPAFKIEINEKCFSINDDNEAIYDNLLFEIIEFFSNGVSDTSGKAVIQTLVEINNMRRTI